jgi:tyrosyl-tRNA synthetase
MKLSGLCSSTGEAMRLIKQGGVTIDDNKCDNPDAKLKSGTYLFKAGKRKFLRIVGKYDTPCGFLKNYFLSLM